MKKNSLTVGIIFVAVIFVGLAAVIQRDREKSPEQPNVFYRGENRSDYVCAADSAISFLKKTCPNLRKWADDIDSVVVSVSDGCGNYEEEEFGWRKQVQIVVKIKDKPELIPAKYRAFGHNLYFTFGGGKSPGMTTNKEAACKICDFEYVDGNTVFVSFAKAKILDSIIREPK